MGFNLLGAIGGAVGGLFTGGPVGAAIGGIEGLTGSPPGNPPGQISMPPPPGDTISSLLGQARPIEDLTSALDPSSLGSLNADQPDAMASIAAFA